MSSHKLPSATSSSSIADILERVLDKGIVIAGDIRVKLVDIELLTIQLRLVVCSIEKAKEIGMDWWNTKLDQPPAKENISDATTDFASRLAALEDRLAGMKRAETVK